jgi:hypothetical protein
MIITFRNRLFIFRRRRPQSDFRRLIDLGVFCVEIVS